MLDLLARMRDSPRLSTINWGVSAGVDVAILFAQLLVLRVATYWVLRIRLH